MIQRLKPKSEFSRNVLTLMTGTTIAQAIPISITPILTRIYTPEDFGLLSVFVAITVVLSSIASGRYELAIMIPEEDKESINIAALGLLIAICFSFVLLILVILLNNTIADLIGNQAIGFWLYFVPFVVLMMGAYNILTYLNIRKKFYKDISKANIYKSVGLVSVQLAVGFVKSGVTGLISGQIFATLVSNYTLAKNAKNHYNLNDLSISEVSRLAKRYLNFPKISVWGALTNTLSFNLVNFIIPFFYTIGTLGYYSLAQKVLGVPSSLIGVAISQVFFKEASEERINTGLAIQSFDKTLKRLVLFSMPIFILLFLFVEIIFAYVFGETWRIAGVYATYLVPFFAINFIVAGISAIDTIMEKQSYYLYFNMILLLVVSSAFLWAETLSFETFLAFLSFLMSTVYLFYGYFLRKMAKNEI